MSNPELMQQLMMNNPQLNQLMEVDYFINLCYLYLMFCLISTVHIYYFFVIQINFKTCMSSLKYNY